MIIVFLIYFIVGSIDWIIKEYSCYPQKRTDTFFWRTIWAFIVYGVAVTLILVFSQWYWIIAVLTEDIVYYSWRAVVYKEKFSDTFYLPFTVFGISSFPMSTVINFWAITIIISIIIGTL